MLRYLNDYINTIYNQNLYDWCVGGPSPNGWTREGPMISLKMDTKISSYTLQNISVDDGLAKNAKEVAKWHISFLDEKDPFQSLYYKEYVSPRYNHKDGMNRMESFNLLYQKMSIEGFDQSYPIYVADISVLDLGFRYFRFDGCHRLSICKKIGIKEVPAFVFFIEGL